METTFQSRVPVRSLARHLGETVVLRGWVFRLRVLASTTFVILRDASGEVQCVGASDALNALHLKLDDAIEVVGSVRSDARAKLGFEVDVVLIRVLNPATNKLPFNASSNISGVGIDARLEYRPLAARNDTVGDVAARWGFWHLSRFAADYSRLFGELPSATRARWLAESG